MKFDYFKPDADIRFLQSKDIIAASAENSPSLIPEGNVPDDAVPDNF